MLSLKSRSDRVVSMAVPFLVTRRLVIRDTSFEGQRHATTHPDVPRGQRLLSGALPQGLGQPPPLAVPRTLFHQDRQAVQAGPATFEAVPDSCLLAGLMCLDVCGRPPASVERCIPGCIPLHPRLHPKWREDATGERRERGHGEAQGEALHGPQRVTRVAGKAANGEGGAYPFTVTKTRADGTTVRQQKWRAYYRLDGGDTRRSVVGDTKAHPAHRRSTSGESTGVVGHLVLASARWPSSGSRCTR